MSTFALRVAINALALWVATLLIPGLAMVGEAPDTLRLIGWFVVAGLILAILNAVIRPILKFLSFPLYILTLGLFSLVVNAAMISLTAWASQGLAVHLVVGSFWAALFGGIVVSLVNMVISGFVDRS
ncbi:phage holin family protein [Actinotignum schaalii]|uniref:phage holin family protein n=1 Tax=Actinotignum schaalii TaxID=59505 RepID=UPI00237E41EC|nr:phage holin family protein [Actinotignum schaalii]MDE1653801.1 phage holin family protein [Actinotignum schaalii]